MDAKRLEKAKKDLGEDEIKKSQSLQQFREYIVKHPFLSHVLQGKKIKFFYNLNFIFSHFQTIRFFFCSYECGSIEWVKSSRPFSDPS